MFTRALVRTPGKSLVDGLSTANLGKPAYHKALDQHKAYISALQECGLEVDVLPPQEEFPDACFIEDVALLTPQCAIITRPGAPTRRGERDGLHQILGQYYEFIETVQSPGTVEGGDILAVGSHYFLGLSSRTNAEGAKQVIEILNQYQLSASTIQLQEMLHLKTGVAYLEQDTLLAWGELLFQDQFAPFNILPVPEAEGYAANCISINGQVLVPAGFPRTAGMILEAGYAVREVDVSEFRKLDGGLSCLSLRF
jgi:dimethylargininase